MKTDGAIINAIAGLDAAIAVLNTDTQTVEFATQGFSALFPAAPVFANASSKGCACFADSSGLNANEPTNSSWRATFGHLPKVLQALENAGRGDKAAGACVVQVEGKGYSIEIKPSSDAQLLLLLQPDYQFTEQLHEYMQARDSLFSTSRTISVSEMATTLAHEINTPIGTISNILRGIKIRLAKPDTSKEVLDEALTRALEQTQFTQSVISRIREFTQSRRPKHRTLDLREQISEAVSLLDWMLSQNSCQIELNLPDKPVNVVGDATMLQQVLINLIKNAVDAMQQQAREHRHIQIALRTQESNVTVSISDTGAGLQNAADTLFVPFSTNKTGGMGVGLNICRSFVELHQGRLWLSPNESQGCTSYMELPLHNEQDSSTTHKDNALLEELVDG